ncbi:MAG: hypothetical protein HN352_08245 [Bacteroidetes bacterium]|jgi:hypothetical protein|nr:hypothetical protein [Bacteroidota bacterium]MBT3751668.1 hypothetical protein [Bacteroidota bacterium]MBT4401249.1 hypothetical protein [Bacteroidota bacterium]MBT4408244.1 hypothetical protein [Bacteroidota bacterium]MBT5425319.1 hypothetical protein [Bacteroidota bacterium]
MKKILLSSLIIVILCDTYSLGQVRTDHLSIYSIYIGIGRQKIDLPGRSLFAFPVHSSFHFGLQRSWSQSSSSPFYQTVDLSIYENASAGSGYLILSHSGYQTPSLFDLSAIFELGAGFAHLFRPKRLFELNEGSFTEIVDLGQIKPGFSLKVGLDYTVKQLSIFVRYEILSLLKYNEDIKVLPMTFLNLGLKYNLKKRSL